MSGTPTTSMPRVLAVGSYELWFVCQLVFAMVYVGVAMFVLPPFTLSLPEATPGDVGIVMAVLPLVALGAPIVGGMLDKFRSFRLFQLLGLALLAVGFGLLSLVDELIGATLGSLILGLGAALVLTTNLTLLASSGLPDEALDSRMSMLQMSIPLGQFLGLVVVAGLLLFEVGFSSIFMVMGGIALIGLLFTALTVGPAERRANQAMDASAAAQAPVETTTDAKRSGLVAVLASSFGLALLVVFITMAAHAAIESQYANFMGDVFDIDGETAAIALAFFVLLSVPVFPVVSRWLASAPYRVPLLVGIAVRGLAGLALWLIADAAGIPAIIPLVLYGAIMVMIPLTDVTGALLSARTSPIGPGGGQGGYGFAVAGAGVTGAFIAGWAASEFGYASVALVVFILAAIGFALGLFIPALRSGSADEAGTQRHDEAATHLS